MGCRPRAGFEALFRMGRSRGSLRAGVVRERRIAGGGDGGAWNWSSLEPDNAAIGVTSAQIGSQKHFLLISWTYFSKAVQFWAMFPEPPALQVLSSFQGSKIQICSYSGHSWDSSASYYSPLLWLCQAHVPVLSSMSDCDVVWNPTLLRCVPSWFEKQRKGTNDRGLFLLSWFGCRTPEKDVLGWQVALQI